MTAVQSKPFIWPSDPAFVSVEEKIRIEAHIIKQIPSMRGEFAEKYKEAHLWEMDKPLLYMGKKDAIWDTGEEVGKGGQTKVIKCYSPVTGQFLVRKKFDSAIVASLLQAYKLLYNQPNCVQMYCNTDHNIFEPLYDTDLRKMIEKKQLISTADKIRAMFHIATAVQGVHSKIYSDGQIKYMLSHKDIKPANIFVKKDPNGQLIFDLGDYGWVLSCDFSGTPTFRSPEKVRSEQLSGKLFVLENGPKLDMWQLGLTFSALLSEIYNPYIWQQSRQSDVVESSTAQLTQNDIDAADR